MKDESREGTENSEFCVYENTPTESSTSSSTLQINTDNIGARLLKARRLALVREPAAEMNHPEL